MKLNAFSIYKGNLLESVPIRKKPPMQNLRGYNGYDRDADLCNDGLIAKWYTKLKSKYVLYKAKKILRANLKKDTPVSKAEKEELIKELFPSGFQNIKLTQSNNIGNCYLIASLQALIDKTSDKFSPEDFFSSVIRKQKDGTFKVTFPGQKEFPIKVTKEEAEFGQVSPRENAREITYEHIKPMDADIGFQIIERAYGRLRRQLEIFESLSQIPKSKMEDTLVLINGGSGFEALQNLTGWQPVHIRNTPNMCRSFDEFAKNPERYALTAGTFYGESSPLIFDVIHNSDGDKIVFMDEAREIIAGHVYTIKSINHDKKEVSITDPYIPSKEIIVSYNNVFNYFLCITGVKVPKKSAF